jgi:hypothetical protein
MKHSCLLALALLAAVSTPAFALDKVRISGTKKTLAKRESSPQTRPRGQTSLTQKMMMYVFSLQRMATEVPAQSTVAWVLIKERKDGRLVEAARGASMVDLPLGREVTLDSTPVELEERDWSGPRREPDPCVVLPGRLRSAGCRRCGRGGWPSAMSRRRCSASWSGTNRRRKRPRSWTSCRRRCGKSADAYLR